VSRPRLDIHCMRHLLTLSLLSLISYQSNSKSPSTEEAEPSISLRVARDMGELPGLVPGLVTKSHWTTLDRQLPFDDSLALLFLQHNVQALPASWTYSLAACYDMIWVTSLAAKDELVQARIPANRIQVCQFTLVDVTWPAHCLPTYSTA